MEPEPKTPEEVDAYLRKHGRDPELIGRWGKAIAVAAFANEEVKRLRRLMRLPPTAAEFSATMDEQTPRKRPSPDDVPDEVMKRIVALYDRELSDEERAEIEDFGQRLARRLHALKLSVPTAAEFNAALDIVAGATGVGSSHGEPYPVPAASGPYRVETAWDNLVIVYHNGTFLEHLAFTNDRESAKRVADALNMQAYMATKIETLRGLLGEVLAGRGIHTGAQAKCLVVELDPDLHQRIKAAVEQEIVGASLR